MVRAINVRTSEKVTPMIYAYTAPGVSYLEGMTKIGYTEQDVNERIRQQTHTAGIKPKLEWKFNAIYQDGTWETFKDTDFHAYLRKNGIKQEIGERNEWFHISPSDSQRMIFEFSMNHGVIDTDTPSPYKLRKEQSSAVDNAASYFKSHNKGEFLWNAKPRFGKTLSTYDLCKTMDVKNVLIVTNRPSIANSWYEDYVKFLGNESGYRFVSETSSLKGKRNVITRDDMERLRKDDPKVKCIEFLSLQDLKGSIYFGGKFDKLEHICKQEWDLLVIDEAHEGVDTYKTDVAFDRIKRKSTLHLSGTPFKALANDKFSSDAIYNWTYADEQKAKQEWDPSSEEENPYANLPKLCLYTYQMSEMVWDEVSQGIEICGETEDYAFDLNEFFITDSKGNFKHEAAVDRFLDALTTQEKYPFSTEELRDELRHTFWLLKYVASAEALAKKLRNHPIFKDYEIIVAAGSNTDDDSENMKAFDKVKKAISENEKTITLSVGQLTTGITIPEWTAVLMLSNIGSPALYMQAAFRAQNPCLFNRGKDGCFRKENAYVFDFDPARTLDIVERFANDLSTETTSGRGDVGKRKEQVRELLNFFPVIGEDDQGRMIELDAEQVLSIPRKIRSVEVVRRGFMSDFLFQNIGNVFHAPPQVWNIISSMEAVKQPKDEMGKPTQEFDVDADGNVVIPTQKIIGTAAEVFGEKIYAVEEDDLDDILEQAEEGAKGFTQEELLLKDLTERFSVSVTEPMMEKAKERFGTDLTKKTQDSLKRTFTKEAEIGFKKAANDLRITHITIDLKEEKELTTARTDKEREAISTKYEQKRIEATELFKQTVNTKIDEMANSFGQTIVEKVMTDKQEKQKRGIEDKIRDHLRGFSRTIPAFLMAYGDENEVTLKDFDTIIPADVFEEVTGITVEDFRLLRDGGDYTDEETGETRHFDGHLFDEVVFDDSVKEFMAKKKALANYFDESAEEDIFNYIPPQKTNQIFTPRETVIRMVDMLEAENPGCFDDETKTFADLCMKSGMYLSEIIKRLYRSERLKELYPEPKERLNHIFAEQVYGVAPSEIIYRITLSYLLGFSDEIRIERHNIVECDVFGLVKEGKLADEIRRLYQ